jgi:hypothetical protein
VSIDLDIHAHGWFLRLAKSYAGITEVGLMQAGAIVNELCHRKAIRDAFMPGAAIEVSVLRAMVARTATLSDTEQAVLAQENAEQLIERLKQRDARFNYTVLVSPDGPPRTAALPGAIFSISSGSTTIHAFPRDFEALQLDPPEVNLKLKGGGVAKLLEFQRTGRPQTLGPDEIAGLSTTLPHIDLSEGEALTLTVKNSLRKRTLPLKLVFGANQSPVVYEYMPFRFESAGTEQVEIVSDAQEVFTLAMSVSQTGTRLTFTERPFGYSVLQADKYIRAIRSISNGDRLEVYDLESGKRLISGRPDGAPPSSLTKFARFFERTALLCEFFNVDLHVNRGVIEDDLRGLELLGAIMDGTSSSLFHLETTIGKCAEGERILLRALKGEVAHLMLECRDVQVSVLDSIVDVGAFRVITEGRLIESGEAKRRWDAAQTDDSVVLNWGTIGDAVITRLDRLPPALGKDPTPEQRRSR